MQKVLQWPHLQHSWYTMKVCPFNGTDATSTKPSRSKTTTGPVARLHPRAAKGDKAPVSSRVSGSAHLIALAHLFIDLEHHNDDTETHDSCTEYDGDPWDPITRMQVQLFCPGAGIVDVVGLIWHNDDLGVRDQAFNVDKVLGLVSCRTDE